MEKDYCFAYELCAPLSNGSVWSSFEKTEVIEEKEDMPSEDTQEEKEDMQSEDETEEKEDMQSEDDDKHEKDEKDDQPVEKKTDVIIAELMKKHVSAENWPEHVLRPFLQQVIDIIDRSPPTIRNMRKQWKYIHLPESRTAKEMAAKWKDIKDDYCRLAEVGFFFFFCNHHISFFYR